jgi:hypothetical protein
MSVSSNPLWEPTNRRAVCGKTACWERAEKRPHFRAGGRPRFSFLRLLPKRAYLARFLLCLLPKSPSLGDNSAVVLRSLLRDLIAPIRNWAVGASLTAAKTCGSHVEHHKAAATFDRPTHYGEAILNRGELYRRTPPMDLRPGRGWVAVALNVTSPPSPQAGGNPVRPSLTRGGRPSARRLNPRPSFCKAFRGLLATGVPGSDSRACSGLR